jgi:hypothetical protein
MRVFLIKSFARFARKAGIADTMLRATVAAMEAGHIDADLGGGLFKQRLARRGKGKSGGFRVLLAYRAGERVVFLAGFAKKDLANVSEAEVAELRLAAIRTLTPSEATTDQNVAAGLLKEIDYE